MKAMLLAAGLGTRLRPLTDDVPKCMIPLAGRPIIEHLVRWLREGGVTDLIVNLHHRPDVIRRHLGDGSHFEVSVEYSQEEELLGTAGAVRKVSSRLGDEFLVVYADNLIRCDLQAVLAAHARGAAAMTIALIWRDDVSRSGLAILDQAGRITDFSEKPATGGAGWVNAGLFVCGSRVMRHIPANRPSDFGHDVIPTLITAGEPLLGYQLRDGNQLLWIDTPEDLARAQSTLAGAHP